MTYHMALPNIPSSDAHRVTDGGNVKKQKQIKGWTFYLALVAAAFLVHTCAVESTLQGAPAGVAAHWSRQV
ncbi:hypothetical protein [Cupriavidus sp. H18C1]|uniref:hypothetical protein n=1 Tax=Cupriavidus sp. H18C1 TaxID=3241601 RepID=UPI003BB8A099